MQTEHLIKMANQIADFFAAYPEEQAVEGVRDHLARFWEPRMRRELTDYAAADGEGLKPLVVEAIRRLPSAA